MTTRRSYAGAAATETLTAQLLAAGTSATISDNANWPSGSNGPFAAVINLGKSDEEKVLVASQASNSLTIQTRGYDGTSARDHASGATVQLCVTAVDLDEANAHTSASAGVHGIAGSVVGDTDVQTLSNKTIDETCSISPSALAGVTVQGINFHLQSFASGSSVNTLGPNNADESGNHIWLPHGATFTPSAVFFGPIGVSGVANYIVPEVVSIDATYVCIRASSDGNQLTFQVPPYTYSTTFSIVVAG